MQLQRASSGVIKLTKHDSAYSRVCAQKAHLELHEVCTLLLLFLSCRYKNISDQSCLNFNSFSMLWCKSEAFFPSMVCGSVCHLTSVSPQLLETLIPTLVCQQMTFTPNPLVSYMFAFMYFIIYKETNSFNKFKDILIWNICIIHS